ncbi:MAG: hypothetical protein JXB29_12960 [Sedimentisphaerales bacterium]|nr:hypothetical protein [Sedimentisphaerales bacterium]
MRYYEFAKYTKVVHTIFKYGQDGLLQKGYKPSGTTYGAGYYGGRSNCYYTYRAWAVTVTKVKAYIVM